MPATLSADHDQLVRVVTAKAADRLNLVRQVCLTFLRNDVTDRPLIHTPQALIDYLRALIAHKPREEVHVVFLDMSGRLIVDEMISAGSIREASVHLRRIVARALDVGAASAILVHNHPSGNSQPSPADIETTKRVAKALAAIDIVLHDHVIVARGGWTSLRAEGVL